MKQFTKYTLFLILFLGLLSCIHKNVQKISETAQPIPSPSATDSELQNFIIELIINSPFSLQQKTKLNELQIELNDKLQINATISVKLRALLFEELLSPRYENRNVDVIATMLERNNAEKISLLLDAIRITNIITKRTTPSNEILESSSELYLLY